MERWPNSYQRVRALRCFGAICKQRLEAVADTPGSNSPENIRITDNPISPYRCSSMSLNRTVPETACDGFLAPGSYVISTPTDYSEHHEQGLVLEQFLEPLPERSDVNYEGEFRVPTFQIYSLRRLPS